MRSPGILISSWLVLTKIMWRGSPAINWRGSHYYVFPGSKLNGWKSLWWLAYVIRAKLWKLLEWTISLGWENINLRLTVTKDSNGSMLDGIKQKSMTRISRLAGINRRDYGIEIKLKSGRGIKELFWGPPYELLLRWKVIRIPISHGIKQKEIVGRVFLGSQVVSLTAITFFTYSNICQLWRILLHYLFLIFVLTIPWKLISITLKSHLLQ